MKPPTINFRLASLAGDVETLLRKLGALHTEHDSARLMSAIGHLASAKDDLKQAAAVARVRRI